TDFVAQPGDNNDIDVSKLSLEGEGGDSVTLTSSAVEISDATQFSVTLNAADQAAVNQLFNKDGASSTGGTTYNLAAAEDWAAGVDASVTVADLTGNGITVSNVAAPTIASATYNGRTGVLEVTGSGFLKRDGADNDIDASRFTITGEAGGTYTLIDTADVEISSATRFSLTLSETDKAAVNALINQNGTASSDNTTYNLAAAEDWALGADTAVDVADLTGNGITATVNQPPLITSNLGGGTAAVNVAENSTAVTTVTATDDDNDTLTFSITGGADQDLFQIDANSGVLSFKTAPDFENPSDSDTNNSYEVVVQASDGNGGSDTQSITVSVTDVNEKTGGGGTPALEPDP
ncbi:MAG: cadherin domain-containing protein, partial [Lamprobacter sp.]|uniref:cadherin repeat domain-containing protein n=1 Tax=Lamprobacter sp. TaxID=3100796 RepID=UPI002B260B4A